MRKLEDIDVSRCVALSGALVASQTERVVTFGKHHCEILDSDKWNTEKALLKHFSDMQDKLIEKLLETSEQSCAESEALLAEYLLKLESEKFYKNESKHLKGVPALFSETTAPYWLTSETTVKGSTMDERWFWTDHVLKMKLGEVKETDFLTITRIK